MKLGPVLRLPVALVLLVAAGCGGEPAEGPRTGGEGSGGAAGATPSSLADSLVGAWIRAAGGMEAWGSVGSARYTVTTVLYDSLGRVDWMRPRRVELKKTPAGEWSRIERPEGEGLYVQVFAADTAWATLNDRPLPADDPAAAESEYVGRDVFYWFGLPFKLRDPGVHLRASRGSGPAHGGDGGHEVRVTFGDRVGAHPGDRYFYYFLDADPYPEEVHYIEEGYTEEDRNVTLWSDFRSAGPIRYVGTRRWIDDEGRLTKELRIDDVVINPELPDSLFRAPDRSTRPEGTGEGGR